jgi:hypothetical protein
MQMREIGIDDEVYRYLASKINDFGESVNTVLRRELRLDGGIPDASDVRNIPKFPPGIPKALEQILQVVFLIRSGGLGRSKATHAVADYHEVAPQTVIDKYTRQLGLTARDFDRGLVESYLPQFREFLIGKFKGYEGLINQYIL